jgi:Zn-dependent protease
VAFLEVLFVIAHGCIRGIFDALIGVRRKTYEKSVFINAPKDIVWKVATARKITFDEFVPIDIDVAPTPADETIHEGTIKYGETIIPISYRLISEKPGEAGVYQYLSIGDDGRVRPEDNYFIAYSLAPERNGTRFSMRTDITHRTFRSRIEARLGPVQGARRIKDHCEKLAGTAQPSSGAGATVTTGVLTFASFFYLYGWQSAAILVGLILIHEAGHALAMKMAGQPVQGIYFIPFFGGVAVASKPHASEGHRGFVALMGPGLSIITTAAFYAAAQATGSAVLTELALMSAILNGINLAPLLPLDGGHVTSALLSRHNQDIGGFIELFCLLVGFSVSAVMGWYVLLVLLALATPAVLVGAQGAERKQPAISGPEQFWLGAAYAATLLFYIFVTLKLLTT